MDISDKMLFGQYLVEKKKITKTILFKALQTQKEEKISNSPRMLGSILLNDFKIFENRIELRRVLKDFEKYQDKMREMYLEAKKYGADPLDKLNQEYADLMEELEGVDTKKIREVIVKIEKFKLDIRKNKNINEMNEINEERIEELKRKNNNLLEEINSLKDRNTKTLDKYNASLKDYDKLRKYIIEHMNRYDL